MTELNLLKDHITRYIEKDIDFEEFDSEYEGFCDDIEDAYSEMKTEVEDAELTLKDEEDYHKVTQSELSEAEVSLSESIVATNLYEVEMLEILQRMYEKLNLPALQKLEQELGTGPKWAPKLAS